MKLLRSVVVFVILAIFLMASILNFPAVSRAQSASKSLGGNLQLRVYYNDVTGNEALSFKSEGLNYLSDLTMTYNEQWGSSEDAIQLEGLVNFRATDDQQFQVRNDTLRLQNAYVTAEKRNAWKLTGGYFNERFTSYTMSTSLLGVNTRFNLSEGLKFHLFSGRDRRARPGNQLARYTGGTRLGWEVLSGQQLGFSYVRTKDRVSSLTDAERNGVSDTVTNDVKSVDFEGKYGLFNSRLEAEVAQSSIDTAPTQSEGEVEDELARLVSLRSNVPRLGNFRFKYEKIDPNFSTVAGFATPDRERSLVTWRNQFENIFGERWYFQGSFETWEDGLESPRQHLVRDWVFELTYDPQMEGYFNSTANFAAESREDEGTTVDNDSNESNRMVYSFTSDNRIGESSIKLDYSYQNEKSDSEVENRYEVVYDQPFEMVGVNSNILLDGIYEEQKNDLGARTAVDRRYRLSNELVFGDGGRESIRLEQGYQEEDSAGSKEIIRVTYGISFDYVLNRQAGNSISFSYLVNDNEDKGDDDQNYKEETVDMRIDYSF